MIARSVFSRAVSLSAVALGLLSVTGCGMSRPRLAYVKSPEASPCKEADCPTLEIPAPNDDEMFNPAASGVVYFDEKVFDKPFIMATPGHIWYVMKVNPGKHSIKVLPEGTNLIGGLTAAGKDSLSFEAQKGKRYWLYSRVGVGGFSSKTWVEESTGDRAVVAGDRNLEAHNIAASLFLGDAEQKAQKARVEMWWAGVPTYDKTFQGPEVERVGGEAGAAAAPAETAKK